MHTLSSARRTCMASASAVECTATVATPNSLQARWKRSAISPGLVIRLFANLTPGPALLVHRQRLAIFDLLPVLDEDGDDGAGAGGGDLVHGLHGLDNEQRLSRCHLRSDLDERRRAGLRGAICGADHRRGHSAGMDYELLGLACCAFRGPRIFALRRADAFARFAMRQVGGQRGGQVHPARDLDPAALMLDLDLGKTGLLEKRRQFADQLLVKTAPLSGHGWLPFSLRRHFDFAGTSVDASASMASS